MRTLKWGLGMMFRSASGCLVAAACLLAQAQTPPPEQDGKVSDDFAKTILQKADEIRFPAQGFEVNVKIRSVDGGGEPEVREYRILSKGNDNTIVVTTPPAAERGQILLMKGRDLWLFLPSVSQPVRLSLAQRLTGQVSNGDIARANFSGDYSPRLVGTEKIGDDKAFVLELTAVDRTVTYHRVKYWVRENGYAPIKAEFYSLSDKLLKACSYEGYKPLGGRTRPARLVMTDAIKADTKSVLDYDAMKNVDLPDKLFTKEYLRKLQ
ncbi:MAG: outer membrane lipoprotein-sorting protein [Betaproteobacteria bacterium]|nr:outer membrane lipoprotein-sorting protein [Betaproteobacteria bacterium]